MEILNTGKILIAEPFMLDPNFKRSVVLLADYHKEEGTFGFILNRPTDLSLTELTEDFPKLDTKVFYGGPVGNNALYFIHNCGDLVEDSVKISSGIYWGGNYDKLRFLIENGLVTENHIRFFLGYSGWDPGQLEDELIEPSWIIGDMDPNYLFKIPTEQLWKECLENKGRHFGIIGQIAEDQIMN